MGGAGAPCIPEILQPREREQLRLLGLRLRPTAPPEGSAYNTAEPTAHDRGLGADTGQKAESGGLSPHCRYEFK